MWGVIVWTGPLKGYTVTSTHCKSCWKAQKYTVFKETHCILSRASTPTATNSHDSQLHAQERHKISNVGARFLTTHNPDKCCNMIWLLLTNKKKKQKKNCSLAVDTLPVVVHPHCGQAAYLARSSSSPLWRCLVAWPSAASPSGRWRDAPPPSSHGLQSITATGPSVKSKLKRPKWPKTGTTLMAAFHDPKTAMVPAIRIRVCLPLIP